MPSMMSELESAFGIAIENDKQVRYRSCFVLGHFPLTKIPPQTLKKVVEELDKTLFDSYVKPRGAIVTSLVRGGILDSNMDWYETPQPTGVSTLVFPSALVKY